MSGTIEIVVAESGQIRIDERATHVILVDGRGCWKLHPVTPEDRFYGDSDGRWRFKLAGAVWNSLPFTRADDVRGEHWPVYRTAQPAIGRLDLPWSKLFLPFGWNPPSVARAK